MKLMALVCSAALVCVCAGCGDGGPALQAVKGTLTQGDKPLAGISVTFTPEKGPSSGGLTNSEGKFVLLSGSGKKGAIAGKHKVVLSGGEKAATAGLSGDDPQKLYQQRNDSMKGGKKGAPAASKEKPPYPPEYADAQKSPLNYEVKEGSNDFDIAIP